MATSPTVRRPSSRDRMINSAIVLLRERGAGATTIDAVLAHSNAPRGSVYHHFPGGRRELVRAALERAGTAIENLIEEATAGAGDPAEALEHFAQVWRRSLVDSDHRAGCPVVALVVEPDPDDDEMHALAADILGRWRARLRAAAVAAGRGGDEDRARRDATFLLSAVEGAILLCRAERSVEPLDDVIATLRELSATA